MSLSPGVGQAWVCIPVPPSTNAVWLRTSYFTALGLSFLTCTSRRLFFSVIVRTRENHYRVETELRAGGHTAVTLVPGGIMIIQGGPQKGNERPQQAT